VRRLAARLARRRGAGVVHEIDGHAVDDAVGGEAVAHADLVLCRDQLHRVDDPVALLHRVVAAAEGRPIVLSTPDRAVVDPDRPLGPPTDPRHRRTWSLDQLELLLLSCGLDVERWWRVPSRPGSGRYRRLAAASATLPRPGVIRDELVVLATSRGTARAT
ncbi:MAG TPA: hypothetical protein VJM49_06545, partial [Acidimicrobiales bacterium]|nr:hypothetical protein [Acidimicrobiales bacterium]